MATPSNSDTQTPIWVLGGLVLVLFAIGTAAVAYQDRLQSLSDIDAVIVLGVAALILTIVLTAFLRSSGYLETDTAAVGGAAAVFTAISVLSYIAVQGLRETSVDLKQAKVRGEALVRCEERLTTAASDKDKLSAQMLALATENKERETFVSFLNTIDQTIGTAYPQEARKVRLILTCNGYPLNAEVLSSGGRRRRLAPQGELVPLSTEGEASVPLLAVNNPSRSPGSVYFSLGPKAEKRVVVNLQLRAFREGCQQESLDEPAALRARVSTEDPTEGGA